MLTTPGFFIWMLGIWMQVLIFTRQALRICPTLIDRCFFYFWLKWLDDVVRKVGVRFLMPNPNAQSLALKSLSTPGSLLIFRGTSQHSFCHHQQPSLRSRRRLGTAFVSLDYQPRVEQLILPWEIPAGSSLEPMPLLCLCWTPWLTGVDSFVTSSKRQWE